MDPELLKLLERHADTLRSEIHPNGLKSLILEGTHEKKDGTTVPIEVKKEHPGKIRLETQQSNDLEVTIGYNAQLGVSWGRIEDGKRVARIDPSEKQNINWLAIDNEVTSDTSLINYLNPLNSPIVAYLGNIGDDSGLLTGAAFANGLNLFKSGGYNCLSPTNALKGTVHKNPAILYINPASVAPTANVPPASKTADRPPPSAAGKSALAVAPFMLVGLIRLNDVISVSVFNHVISILVVSFKKKTKLPSNPLISASVLTFLEPAFTIEEINIPSVVFWKYAAFNNIAPSRNMPFAPISKTPVSS